MAKLYYFDGRGRGELVRLCLAAAGIEFTEEFLTSRDRFLELINEGKLIFNQVPMLEIDGKYLVQSTSIARYLGRKAGLTGKNDDEVTLIDMYFEGGRDFITPALRMLFLPEAEVLANMKVAMGRCLPVIEKILAANGTGFFVGNSLTLADICWVEGLYVYGDYLGMEIYDSYPAIQKFYATVTSQPRIAAYLKGPQSKQKNNVSYVANAKKVLGWD